MKRSVIAVFFTTLLFGCAAVQQVVTEPGLSTFHSGLDKIEKSGDTSALKEIARNEPDSPWGTSSKKVLKIYAEQQKQILSLRSENAALSEENKKLHDNLDKLNKINLELEKRSN